MTAILSGWVVLDLSSGAYFDASQAYLVNFSKLPGSMQEAFCEGSDSERREIAEMLGIDLETVTLPEMSGMSDKRALDAVAALLSNQEWSSDAIDAVTEMVRLTGRAIEDYDFSAPADAGDDS